MQLFALLSIGFSLFCSVLLITSNIIQQSAPQQLLSKLAGFTLILCLATIQWLNLQYILEVSEHIFSPFYIILLYLIAPSFYFYSHQILTTETSCTPFQSLHALPPIIGLLLPINQALPFVFLIGSGYLLWLGKAVYLLRKQRKRFKLELLALASFFCIAIAVIILGFIWPLMNPIDFISYYSLLIGLAFFATVLTFLRFPSITEDVAEAAQATYAESTLNNIDRKSVLVKLSLLMKQEKLYTHENLSLTLLAEQLDLTPHQLSELINTEFQQGFSKFIRQYRIEEAKRMLVAEPDASVLSIGLSVGFNSQSNFYTAFREISGIAPGQYRKQLKK
jgi:AraC-like DNA-binding protein